MYVRGGDSNLNNGQKVCVYHSILNSEKKRHSTEILQRVASLADTAKAIHLWHDRSKVVQVIEIILESIDWFTDRTQTSISYFTIE